MRNLLTPALIALVLGLAPAARAETKIAFVDIQRAETENEEGKAITVTLKKELDDKQKQLDNRQGEVQALRADFEKQQAVITDAMKASKKEEIDKRLGELQQMYVQLQQDMANREHELFKGIDDRLRQVIKEVAEGESMQLVLAQPVVIWATPSLDITNEVIRRYNAKFPYKPGDAAKPVAKPADAAPAKPDAKPAVKPASATAPKPK